MKNILANTIVIVFAALAVSLLGGAVLWAARGAIGQYTALGGPPPNRAAVLFKTEAPDLVKYATPLYETRDREADIDKVVYRVQDSAQDLLIRCVSDGGKDGNPECKMFANLKPAPAKADAPPAPPAPAPDAGVDAAGGKK